MEIWRSNRSSGGIEQELLLVAATVNRVPLYRTTYHRAGSRPGVLRRDYHIPHRAGSRSGISRHNLPVPG